MELADFFDKTALAASHLLQGYDRAAFEARLSGTPIEVAFDGAAVTCAEGLATLDLLIRLLARIYPCVRLSPLDDQAALSVPELQALAVAINPAISFDIMPAVVTLAVGDTNINREHPVYYLGSLGWAVRFSPEAPVGSGVTSNPFGAGAAACFGAANVFRTVFSDQLSSAGPDRAFSLSLLNFEIAEEPPSDAGLDLPVDIGEVILVGLGAIGQAFSWALARLPVQGRLDLVDPERIELSNLQRYVLTHHEHIGACKTELIKVLLDRPGLTVSSNPVSWEKFLADRSNWHLPLVLTAVDTAADRVTIQSSLPGKVLNAWTQVADLGISRHFNFRQNACLACLYYPKGGRPSESKTVADALGIPESEVTIRELLFNNAPVDEMLLRRIAEVKNMDAEALLPFVGRPIRSFYSQDVCGSLLLGAVGGRQTQTPMAFQSALAGILLASELIIEQANFRAEPLPALTRIDLLRPLAVVLNEALQKMPGCICSDSDYLNRYADKYGL